MKLWLTVLRLRTQQHGQAAVSKALGVSRSTVCQVLKGSYEANTDAIEQRVMDTYGIDDIDCPVLGVIQISSCARNREIAAKVGMKCGNPRTMLLYVTCERCKVMGEDYGNP